MLENPLESVFLEHENAYLKKSLAQETFANCRQLDFGKSSLLDWVTHFVICGSFHFLHFTLELLLQISARKKRYPTVPNLHLTSYHIIMLQK